MNPKAVIRRIDELGRICIPKEIRRTLDVDEEGTPIEIYTENGKIILQKYDPDRIG